ncbi:MAG: hypothetical protein NC401_19500 [Ruminococcus sp.]|nr:hypothetical protein [Ruminococcus sp.]
MPKYIVTDGIKCLKQTRQKQYRFTDETNATVWRTYKQAYEALENGVPEWLKDVFFVENANQPFDKKEGLKRLICADTSDFNRWLSEVGNFRRFVNTIDAEKNGLLQALSKTDEEICDILHYVEFGNLNAAQGWAASVMIKNARIQRRKIKDLLYIINEIQHRNQNVSEAESAKNAIARLNQRKYTPRKLAFLFEGNIYIHC